MVCKEDVITWFKEAASYRRIDVMCSLLNMCVPFEVRFLGTCIEEQGKHDYQELRGAALIANDLEKLSKELSASKGPLDMCTRHRLTIYMSLLQSRNYTCANWIYNTLLRTDAIDTFVANGNFNKDANLYTEFLLLFTLALNHPAFTFEQKLYFGDIVARLAEPEVPMATAHAQPSCPPGLGYNLKPALPLHHHVPLGLPKNPTMGLGECPLPPPGIPHPAVHNEFISPAGMWSRPPYMNTSCPPPPPPPAPAPAPPEVSAFPPPISPHVSQQSSPTPSRSVSPTRVYPCRPHPPAMPTIVTHIDRLPPPVKDPLLLSAPQYNTDLKTVPIDEGSHVDVPEKNQWMDTVVLSGTGLPKLHNGLLTSGVLAPGKCQPVYLASEMQSLSLEEPSQLRCSSSSGSSNSSECQSPPDTPTDTTSVVTPHGPGRGGAGAGAGAGTGTGACASASAAVATASDLKMRLNGSSIPPGLTTLSAGDISTAAQPQAQPLYTTNCSVPYTSHYPVAPHTSYPNRSLFYSQAYRPQFPTYQQNGDIPYLFPHHYLPMMYSNTAIAPPKLTCYNCGLLGHIGSDCKEPNIEDITQKNGYQLDYTSPPPDAPSDKQ